MGKLSEADRKAIARYHKNKTKTFSVRFLKDQDADIIEYLDSRSTKTDVYRKALRMLMIAEHYVPKKK